jgi:hypothetical protein
MVLRTNIMRCLGTQEVRIASMLELLMLNNQVPAQQDKLSLLHKNNCTKTTPT